MRDAGEHAFGPRAITHDASRRPNTDEILRARQHENVPAIVIAWYALGRLAAYAGGVDRPAKSERSIALTSAVDEVELGPEA